MKKSMVLLLMIVGLFGLSACGDFVRDRDKPLVMATLFPQFDMARHIGGDFVDVKLVLPPGIDAHGFDPTFDDVRGILDADLLLYTGDALEPWVSRFIIANAPSRLRILDLSTNVERIGLIPPSRDIGTPPTDTDNGFDGELEGEIDTFEIREFQDDGSLFAYVHDNHWHGALPNVGVDRTLTLTADIIDIDLIPRPLDAYGEPNGLGVRLAENAPEGIVALENRGDHVLIQGLAPGITMLEFYWIYEDQVRYITPPINMQVREHVDHDDSMQYDPHFWMDPLNAIQMVRDIRDEFIKMAPEHEAYFRANAQAYIHELNTIHQAYLHFTEHRQTDVMMHGGHYAFGYFAHRYDVIYKTPYRGFSSDAEPTSRAIADMIDLMNEHNITHLFTEMMIRPHVAQAIRESTGAEILYLYSAENAPAEELEAGITFADMLWHNLTQFKKGMMYDGPE